VGGEEGEASFDLLYTPVPPAVFTGAFREALEDGSLAFHAGLEVQRAGRYVVTARVEDAAGRAFALLRESAVLAEGKTEVRLQLFGKVVLDEGATGPFRLRDVEGLRFDEGGHPDRETMAPLDGVVLTTRAYGARDFSAAAWESADKTRRVAALQREVRAVER
jgi:hypothetical protein